MMRNLIGFSSTLVFATVLAVAARSAPLQYEFVPIYSLPQSGGTSASVQRPNILPDGVVARGTGSIRAAWFTGPTRRYAHGVLGDDIEASGLAVETSTGTVLSLALGRDAVFEDRIPRLVDLDGDGKDEVLVVKSYQTEGAALALIAPVDGKLAIIAEGDSIGLSHRWLNPIGVGDFDGDGRIETAHIETPHIGGILVLSRLKNGHLVSVRRIRGFSNHRMGSRELGLSAVLDADGDGVLDIAVPDDTRADLRIVTFAGGSFRELGRIEFDAEIVSSFHLTKTGATKRKALAFKLSNGRVVGLAFGR